MRYCLTCRHFSADGPLCTHCGRSFGGRLCNHKKGRHLNPPDAQVCGQCGTTDLRDAAFHLPLGCVTRLIVAGIVLGLVWWGGHMVFQGAGLGGGAVLSLRCLAFRVIEKSVNVFCLLFMFYALTLFLPDEAGKRFRELILKVCIELLRFSLQIVWKIAATVSRLLWRLVEGEKVKQ